MAVGEAHGRAPGTSVWLVMGGHSVPFHVASTEPRPALCPLTGVAGGPQAGKEQPQEWFPPWQCG